MLKEQIMSFAMKAISQAYETKERIKNGLQNDVIKEYIRVFKDAVTFITEKGWQTSNSSEIDSKKTDFKWEIDDAIGKNPKKKKSNGSNRARVISKRNERKSSVKSAKEIGSKRADVILKMVQEDQSRFVKRADMLNGKKSLACLVWALGHAERANVKEGISVHDVSALLYKACNIELYPINISRAIYGNSEFVKQVGQQKRTKTYLLTPKGQEMFAKEFL